jgi:membrane protease YdiL (CAAX protease family)
MKSKEEKGKRYFLLFLGITFLIVGIVLSIFAVDYRSRYDVGTDSFELIFVGAVFIAPFIEELTFRGQYSPKKVIKTISLLLIIGWTISKYQEGLSFTLGIFLVTVILLRKTKFLTRENFIPVFIILNSLFFALGHLRSGEYGFNHDSYVLLAPLGTGLIINWICLNYRFRNAIYFHAGWNFIVLSLLFLTLQFPNGETTLQETEHGTLKYEKTPYYGEGLNEVVIKNTELRLIGNSITALFDVLELIDKSNSSIDFEINSPFTKYHMSYKSKHDTIFYQDFFQALIREEIIQKP